MQLTFIFSKQLHSQKSEKLNCQPYPIDLNVSEHCISSHVNDHFNLSVLLIVELKSEVNNRIDVCRKGMKSVENFDIAVTQSRNLNGYNLLNFTEKQQMIW